MTMAQACVYCGSRQSLTIDHLVPRIRGGSDEADNLVYACRRCNSSKGGRDLVEWMRAKEQFPSILLLRRYLKIVARYCEKHGYGDIALSECENLDLPFDPRILPTMFPPLIELKLWMEPAEG